MADAGGGTGFQELMGYRLTDWREDLAILELALGERHLNRSGVIHGGVLMSLLDTACGYAGCFCPEPGRVRRAMTLSLTANFVAQVKGGILTAVGRKRPGGGRIFFCDGEISDEGHTVVAVGVATFRYRQGSEHMSGVAS